MERLREETKAQIKELEKRLEEKTRQIRALETYQEKAGLLEEEISRIQEELSQNRLTSAEALTTSKQSHIQEIQVRSLSQILETKFSVVNVAPHGAFLEQALQ